MEVGDGGAVGHAVRAAIPPPRVTSLSSATRDYAQAVDGSRFDRLDAKDLTRLRVAMGAEIWAWQYARRLTGQPPWRAASAVEGSRERIRADRQMNADIATWEAALVELDAEAGRARLYGRPVPEPLAVPPAVLSAIEARRAASLERAARRRGRDGDGYLAPSPEGTVEPPSPPV
ncbi:hypothetical protein [Methylobacterium sp. J-092]|uniref:hypothetical protein n=1 Tax=Methylobacterium sp. J-092 TaxID=2836667 RepID=UPI001FBB9745|nr:hypothetical protein [Methylobacterium sp. J-092]MCJ2006261.1 hypothetical protein [Methylobacterium sp. J-092]